MVLPLGAGLRLHPVVPLIALLGLVHLGIPLPCFVLGGARRRNQGGIHDRALAHCHAPCAEVGFDGRKDLARPARASHASGGRSGSSSHRGFDH